MGNVIKPTHETRQKSDVALDSIVRGCFAFSYLMLSFVTGIS